MTFIIEHRHTTSQLLIMLSNYNSGGFLKNYLLIFCCYLDLNEVVVILFIFSFKRGSVRITQRHLNILFEGWKLGERPRETPVNGR